MAFFYEYITKNYSNDNNIKKLKINSKLTSSLDEDDFSNNFDYDSLSDKTDDNISEKNNLNNIDIYFKYNELKDKILIKKNKKKR